VKSRRAGMGNPGENNIYRKERIMKKRMLWLGVVVMAVGLCSSGALATTLGPPAAGLDAEQFSIGLDYSVRDLTLSLDGKREARVRLDGVEQDNPDESFSEDHDFDSDMIFTNFGYGVSENLEIFARFGLADISDRNSEFVSGKEFAWGFGTKVTFYDEDALKLGVLCQMVMTSGENTLINDDFGVEVEMPTEMDWYEIKIAAGPSYELNENVLIYGGPFYQVINGDIDADGFVREVETDEGIVHIDLSMSTEVEATTNFGGYIGTQLDIGDNFFFAVEYQFTGDNNAFGAGFVYKF